MSRALLMFKLPQDRTEFRIASKAMDWALTVYAIRSQLGYWKNDGNPFKSIDDALDGIIDLLDEQLGDRAISLEEIE